MRTWMPKLALVGAVAPWFVSLLVPAPAQAQAQDVHLARNLAATCANCHGSNGEARGAIVVLAGQPADKTITAMADFKSGARPATVMQQIAKGYTDEQIKLLAAFFANHPANHPAAQPAAK